MTRYVAYVRISSEDQVGNFSLDAQQHTIEKWIADQEGRLVHTYVDEGYSGLTTDRPAFIQMRHDARQAKFDAIVVHKFDRFARNHADAIALKALFRYELNVKIYSVTEPSEDSDGAMGLLMESMIEGVIDWYSKNLSKETAKGKKERARQGYHNNRPPFGMDKDQNGILITNQHELIGLIQAYESYATGNYSDTDVAHQLNDAGYRSKTGRKFSTDTVRDMLQNRTYPGYVKYQPYKKNADGSRSYKSEIQWFDGLHDAIIPQSLFDKVQEMRAKRRPKVLKDWHHNRTYLLSNLIYCADCVQNIPQDVTYDSYGKMRVQKLRGVSRYRCRARDLGYTCGQNSVNAVEIENQVINIIKNLQLSTDKYNELAIEIARRLSEQSLTERITEIKAIIDRMDFRWDKGFVTDQNTYIQKRTELQNELEKLTPIPEDNLKSATDIIDNFASHWDSTIDRGVQEKLLNLIVQRLWVRGNDVTTILLHPNYYLHVT